MLLLDQEDPKLKEYFDMLLSRVSVLVNVTDADFRLPQQAKAERGGRTHHTFTKNA